jgi:hypothetical protein
VVLESIFKLKHKLSPADFSCPSIVDRPIAWMRILGDLGGQAMAKKTARGPVTWDDVTVTLEDGRVVNGTYGYSDRFITVKTGHRGTPSRIGENPQPLHRRAIKEPTRPQHQEEERRAYERGGIAEGQIPERVPTGRNAKEPLADAAAWMDADNLRAYVAAWQVKMEGNVDKVQLEEWVAWALSEANRLDPLSR